MTQKLYPRLSDSVRADDARALAGPSRMEESVSYRFAVVALGLAMGDAAGDFEIFSRAAAARNALAHGNVIDPATFPSGPTLQLTLRYLDGALERLHREG